MSIIEQINTGIKDAMRSRNQLRLDTLRMLKSKILAVDARGALPDAEVLKLFKTYQGNIKEACEMAQTTGRTDSAEKLSEELKIIQEFLPLALSPEETKKIVEQAISDTGAKSRKEFGFVMKRIMELNNTVDGKLAKDYANEILAE